MRPLLLLLACSACSLALDTDDLRALQGGEAGPADAGPDVPLADAIGDAPVDSRDDSGDASTDAPSDSGDAALDPCFGVAMPNVDTIESSVGGAGVQLTIEFGEGATNGWSALVDGMPQEELTFSATTATFLFPIRLFQNPMVMLVLTHACGASREAVLSLSEVGDPTIESWGGGANLSTSHLFGATMDIDDEGTVVFSSHSGSTDDTLDDIIRWRRGEATGDVVATAVEFTTRVNQHGLVAPRISDDGRLITYNSDGDRLFHYVFDNDGSPTTGAFVGVPTDSVSNDLRFDARSSRYHFAMRRFVVGDGEVDQDFLFLGSFSSRDFTAGGDLALTRLPEKARSPFLHTTGTVPSIAAVIPSSGAGDPARPIAARAADGGWTRASDCQLDELSGLVATDGTRVALVGTCDGTTGPGEFLIRTNPGVFVNVGDDLALTGLLSANRTFTTFLLRSNNQRWIVTYDGMSFDTRRLDRDDHPATVGPTYLSTAALSPNGRWAVFAYSETVRLIEANDPGTFKLARVWVQ